jgi:hypothetical protein
VPAAALEPRAATGCAPSKHAGGPARTRVTAPGGTDVTYEDLARLPPDAGTVYAVFNREQYGFATQTFWSWMGDQVKGFGLVLGLGGLGLMVLYGVLRRVGRSWWLWAAGVIVAFNVVRAVVAPVFIAPLFNTYTRLTDPRIRDPILAIVCRRPACTRPISPTSTMPASATSRTGQRPS